MHPRQTTMEIFSTFLCFEDDTVSGWMTDGRLRRSMQSCLERVGTEARPTSDDSTERETSAGYWALYWHQTWQTNQAKIATDHLAAYLQEVCYWSAQKLAINSSGGQSIADFFQVAIIKLDRVLKGFNLQQGNELKSYASFAFTNAIKDMLRQRQAVEICTDWALLHKVSHKRLGEALQNFGLNAETSAVYLFAWQCFKTIDAPSDLQGSRKLGKPDAAKFMAIANLYNSDRVSLLSAKAPPANPDSISTWLTTCGTAVRNYLYPTLVSASHPKPQTESEEFLDDFAVTFQDSLLTQAIDREEAATRTQQQLQLQKVLLKALIKIDAQSQRLLQMYYGQGATQQEIAKQLATKQYTISRRISSARQGLLAALGEWSQATLHQSLDTNVLNDMSISIEEWLKAHYTPPDLPTEH
jgi:RNA polymerase sigma factor (sigma-70 family)